MSKFLNYIFEVFLNMDTKKTFLCGNIVIKVQEYFIDFAISPPPKKSKDIEL